MNTTTGMTVGQLTEFARQESRDGVSMATLMQCITEHFGVGVAKECGEEGRGVRIRHVPSDTIIDLTLSFDSE